MAIYVKNLATGEVTKVHNVKAEQGIIHAEGQCPFPKTRFFNNYPFMFDTGERLACLYKGETVEVMRLALRDGYELETKRQRKVQPKATSNAPTPNEPTTAKAEPQPVPTASASVPTASNTADDDALALARMLMAMKGRGASVNADEVRAICTEVLASYASAEPKKIQLASKAAKKASGEYYCKDFEDIRQDVADGYNVYLYGAAGSGKSHTAEQIAEALGLDFYAQTTIQFAHDVRGYGDAGGNYVGTPFFDAFSKGGLYFQDEYDRSYAEAAIVLNTALANGYYDFPTIGRVKAHEKFRFMAAGNTLMKGADEEYVTGQTIDASSRDRFGAFYECEYSHEVELNAIAKGDTELVEFIEDVRKAIKATGIHHVVSYRATAYMVNRQTDKAKTLQRCTFKGLLVDDIRMIYGALSNTRNEWAKAMQTII